MKEKQTLPKNLNGDINNFSCFTSLILPDNERIRSIYILSLMYVNEKGRSLLTLSEAHKLFRKTKYYSPTTYGKRRIVEDLVEHSPPLLKRFKVESFCVKIYFLKDNKVIEGNLEYLSDYERHLRHISAGMLDISDIEEITTFLEEGYLV